MRLLGEGQSVKRIYGLLGFLGGLLTAPVLQIACKFKQSSLGLRRFSIRL